MANFELDVAVSRYNTATKRLADSAGSSPLASRRNVEQEYALAAQQLMRHGYLWRLKRKYTKN